MQIFRLTAPKSKGVYKRDKDPVKKFFQDQAGGESIRVKFKGKKPSLPKAPWESK